MSLFPRRPRLMPLQLPLLDGTSWPDRRDVRRPSFAGLALYQMGYREAFDPEARGIAELLVAHVLPMLRIDAAPEDAPYLHRVFTSAAQIGAGIGIVERRVANTDERSIDRQIAGALWNAVSDLPPMPPHPLRVARYLLQSGHYLARTNPAAIPLLQASLGGEDHPSGS